MDALKVVPLHAQERPPRKVFVRDLELIASVGVYEHEKRYLQRVIVSLELDVRDTYNGETDRIDDVYDYDLAISAAKDTFDQGHVNLLETAAERIADACLAHPLVDAVTVRLEKPDVVPSCRSVGIEVRRTTPPGARRPS